MWIWGWIDEENEGRIEESSDAKTDGCEENGYSG